MTPVTVSFMENWKLCMSFKKNIIQKRLHIYYKRSSQNPVEDILLNKKDELGKSKIQSQRKLNNRTILSQNSHQKILMRPGAP